VPLDVADHAAMIAFCQANKIDFAVVGRRGRMCAGIVDALEGAGIKTFGPNKGGGPAGEAPRASPRTCAGRTKIPDRRL
jgi:phosphoribosylamine--glycine ligase